MNKNIKTKEMFSSLKSYARDIMSIDDRIYEVVLIGSLINGNFNSKSDIDIICLFAPDFDDPAEGWETISTIHNKMKEKQAHLGITFPIDLGWMQGSVIRLGNTVHAAGVVFNYGGAYMVLNRIKNPEGFEYTVPFHKKIKNLCEICDVVWECEICKRCTQHCDCGIGFIKDYAQNEYITQ
jgi:hypothetical protein